MKYLFLMFLSLSAFSNDYSEIEAIYSSSDLALKLDYSTIESTSPKEITVIWLGPQIARFL